MSACPLCGKDIDQSRYLAPAEVHGRDGLKLAHIEHCSTDDLKRMLKLRAKRELEFFQDASKLAENLDIESIRGFEKKYGNYDELAQTLSDREMAVIAVIDELKKRLRKP